jgi:hypothetical protein
MRRSFRCLFVLLAALMVGLAVAWLVWPRSAISAENAARICDGMTLAEVEEILGGPPRDETNDGYDLVLYRWTKDHVYFAPADRQKQWVGPQSAVWIVLGDDGRVVSTSVGETQLRDETLLQKARRWLGL